MHYFTNTRLSISQKNINLITTDKGKVSFSYSSGRQDLTGGVMLSSVTLKDHQNVQIDSYELNYNYFNKKPLYYNITATEVSCGGDKNCNRLKLLSINNNGSAFRAFEYEESTLLPPRDSPHIDHWGYANGYRYQYGANGHRAYSSLIPEVNIIENSTPVATFEGVDKSSHFDATKAYALNKVIFPTGGYQKLVYEPHTQSGGLRIFQVLLSDGTSEWTDREYTYEEAETYSRPKYHYYLDTYSSDTECFYAWCETTECKVEYILRKSQSLTHLYDLGGVHVGYGRVTEALADGGEIVQEFYNFSDRPDSAPSPVTSYKYKEGPIYMTYFEGNLDPNGLPFAPYTSYAWERGNLADIYYKNASGKTIRHIHNDYNFDLSEEFNISSWVIDLNTKFDNEWHLVYAAKYDVVIKPFSVQQSIVSDYDQDNTNSISTTTAYTYNTQYPSLVSEVLQTLADGTELKTTFKYPKDYNISSLPTSPPVRSGAIKSLGVNNSIATPLEVVYYKKGPSETSFAVVGAKLTTYKKYGGNVSRALPFEEYQLLIQNPISDFQSSAISTTTGDLTWDSRYKKMAEYTYDPNDGQVISIVGEDETEVGYTWTAEGRMASEIVNPSSNAFSTTYTHEPMVGLKQVEDLNGKIRTYEYDHMNRLKLIKNNDGHITTRYRYHQKNELGIDATFTSSRDFAEVGQSISFTATGADPVVGKNQYYWDFKDNTVVEDDKYISHSYSATGTYNVTLTLLNPEYETVQFSKQIKVYQPMEIGLCVDGPAEIDICGTNNPTYGTCTSSGNTSITYVKVSSLTKGCNGPYTYEWHYQRPNSSTWYILFGSSNTVQFPEQLVSGYYTIRCTVTDSCGTEAQGSATTLVRYYQSDADCGGAIQK
ncbi:PKD domain-containing protein [Fulvivirga imtechensis]|nr:PKD domain-containing protein [Fulvivirga imtechensis]